LLERKKGIGGSDAAAAIGLNPYKSPLELYQEKRGEIEPPDLSDNEAVHFGNVLEDTIANEYFRRTGQNIRRKNQIVIHPRMNWMRANVDRILTGQNKILECKAPGFNQRDQWGEPGTDEIPLQYLVQCVHYMIVGDYDGADVAALIGGREFRVYHIQRDRDLEANIIEKERDFWENHVVPGVPPAPRTIEEVLMLFPKSQGKAVIASVEVEQALARMAKVNEEKQAIDEELSNLKTVICTAMNDAEIVKSLTGTTLATWKNDKEKTVFDVQAAFEALAALYPDKAQEIKKAHTATKPGVRRFLNKVKIGE